MRPAPERRGSVGPAVGRPRAAWVLLFSVRTGGPRNPHIGRGGGMLLVPGGSGPPAGASPRAAHTRRRGPSGEPCGDRRSPRHARAADPAEASGTFNPLCKVLCILQSLYLCAIGPAPVFFLAVDTPRCSNCSPKPLYSWMARRPRPAGARCRNAERTGQYPCVVSHSRALPGAGPTRGGAPPAPVTHSIC